ncbi:MAG TPA: DUF3667 domain-containing protein [Fimbriimonadaceae bacterium]|nr:DUF3667 domain-containing protein [Fimbriimonadaceae bacterium]
MSTRLSKREVQLGPTCLNCSAGIETHFCPHCGQRNTPPDLSLKAVLREFFVEIFYYDSKLWRTLRTLLVHPGRLSNEWVQGRRTRFLSPVRLYLTVTFLFFLLAAWRSPTGIHFQTNMSEKDKEQMIKQISNSRMSEMARQATLSAEPELHLSADQKVRLEAALDKAVASGVAAQQQSGPNDSLDQGLSSLARKNSWMGRQLAKLESAAVQDRTQIAARYFEQIPKALFVILPLCALVLKLLYAFQRRTYVEHLVFLLHFHSFMFLVLVPGVVFSNDWMSAYTGLTLLIWIPAYAFIAMLRFYRQAWWLTLLKSWFLGAAYTFLAMVGALLALVLLVTALPDAPTQSPQKKPSGIVAPTIPGSAPPKVPSG